MAVVRELEAARRERTTGHAGLCRDCGTTHRGHVACPEPDHWLYAHTRQDDPYPTHLLMRKL